MKSQSNIYLKPWHVLADRKLKIQLFLLVILAAITILLEIAVFLTLPPLVSSFFSEGTSVSITILGWDFILNIQNAFFSTALLIFSSNLLRILSLVTSIRISKNVGININKKLVLSLIENKLWTLENTNHRKLLSDIGRRIDLVVYNIIMTKINNLINLLLIVSISVFLIFNIPFVAILTILFLLVLTLILIFSTRGLLKKKSHEVNENTSKLFDEADELISSVRELIINNGLQLKVGSLSRYDEIIRSAAANIHMIGVVPRYLTEFIFMFSGLLFLYYASQSGLIKNFDLSQSVVILYALQKMLPLFQQTYQNHSAIVGHSAVWQELITDLVEGSDSLEHRNALTDFEEFSFAIKDTYNEQTNHLRNLNFVVCKGDRIAVTGKSGSGKSTLIDFILGFRQVEAELSLNGNIVDRQNIRVTRDLISYVPQDFTIFDKTLYQNVYLDGNVSDERIKQLEVLSDLVNLNINRKYFENSKETLGVDGGRLSGGQKSKIAIMRALVKDSPILILDEAFNAIDYQSRDNILNYIFSDPNKAIIIISHDQNDLKYCSKQLRIEP